MGGRSAHVSIVLTRNRDTDTDNTEDVEEENSDVNSLDSLGDVLSRVLGLSSCDCHDFGTDEGEGGLRKDSKVTEELGLGTDISTEWSGISPVFESVSYLETEKERRSKKGVGCGNWRLINSRGQGRHRRRG